MGIGIKKGAGNREVESRRVSMWVDE